MIATRFFAGTAIILAVSALAGAASASTVESNYETQNAFDTGSIVTLDTSLSGERALNREAEKRGRRNEAGEDRRGRHGR